MAQRIQVLCDFHMEKDEEVEGSPLTFGLAQGGSKMSTYEVDLCEVCSKELVDLLAQVSTVGRQVPGPKRKSPAKASAPKSPAVASPTAGPEPAHDVDLSAQEAAKVRALSTGRCPLCDYVAAGAKSAHTSVRRHLKEVHGTTLDAALGLPTPYACTDCDMAFGKPQGLALHRKRMHKS